jgi:hypothetical protein
VGGDGHTHHWTPQVTAMKRLILALVVLPLLGCADSTPTSKDSVTQLPADAPNAITPKGVGEFVFGESTLADILGEDTSENRRRFSDQGFTFQFDRGVTLTGITVRNSDYKLPNGLGVGATADSIRSKLGEPIKDRIENEKLSIDALVYSDFTFYLDANNNVAAIFIGPAF